MTAPQPVTQEWELLGRDDEPLRIKGRLLGFATSKRDIHAHDVIFVDDEEIDDVIKTYERRVTELSQRLTGSALATAQDEMNAYITDLCDAETPRRYALPGQRCSACRWFEVRIFEVDQESTSDNAPWEDARARYLLLTYGLSDVPGEVAKRRTTWTNSPFTVLESLTQRRGSEAFLPATSARVLAEAAAVNSDIQGAYLNRAVA